MSPEFQNLVVFVATLLGMIVAIGAIVAFLFRSRATWKVVLGTILIFAVLIGGLALLSRTTVAQSAQDNLFCPAPVFSSDYPMYIGTGVTPPYTFGANTSSELHDWFQDTHGSIIASYPSGQEWGTLYITKNAAASQSGDGTTDVSQFHCITVEMRGQSGGESVFISVKDASTPPDQPSLARTRVNLSSAWQDVKVPLSSFPHTDLARLFIVFELDFDGTTAQSIEFRNLRYAS